MSDRVSGQEQPELGYSIRPVVLHGTKVLREGRCEHDSACEMVPMCTLPHQRLRRRRSPHPVGQLTDVGRRVLVGADRKPTLSIPVEQASREPRSDRLVGGDPSKTLRDLTLGFAVMALVAALVTVLLSRASDRAGPPG